MGSRTRLASVVSTIKDDVERVFRPAAVDRETVKAACNNAIVRRHLTGNLILECEAARGEGPRRRDFRKHGLMPVVRARYNGNTDRAVADARDSGELDFKIVRQ